MIKAEFKSYGSYTTDSVSQWDLNQKLTISGLDIDVAPVLAFSCFGMYESIIVQSKLSDGVITCDVPNAILQFGKNLNVDLCSETGGQYKAFEKMIIPVNRRKKPSDYLFTDNVPLSTYESIKADLEEDINSNKTYMDKVKTELKNDNKILNGRIDTILTGTVNATKLVTVHSATIRNNSASDLTFKISSKDNETLKSIKDKSPTVINANVIAKALDGVAINGKGIPSSYNVESTNDEYVITVYSGSSSVVGQYVFMAVVTIAYKDTATDISSAELKDIRTGANGTTYPTAGDAVREQINDLKKELDDSNLDENVLQIQKNMNDISQLKESLGNVVKITETKSTNKLNFTNVEEQEKNNITMSYQDNVLSLNGTASATTEFTIPLAENLSDGIYKFYYELLEGDFNQNILYGYQSKAYAQFTKNTTTVKDITINGQNRSKISLTNGQNFENCKFHIWAESSSEATGIFSIPGTTQKDISFNDDLEIPQVKENESKINNIQEILETKQEYEIIDGKMVYKNGEIKSDTNSACINLKLEVGDTIVFKASGSANHAIISESTPDFGKIINVIKVGTSNDEMIYEYTADQDIYLVLSCRSNKEYSIEKILYSEKLKSALLGILNTKEDYRYLLKVLEGKKGLCVGDSLTYGVVNGASSGAINTTKNYPYWFNKMTNLAVDVDGHPGWKASQMYEHVKSNNYAEYGFILLFLGTNGGLTTDEQISAYKQIIEKFINDNNSIKIFLITPFAVNGYSKQDTVDKIYDIGKEKEIAVVNADIAPFKYTVVDGKIHEYDITHLSEMGYFLLANVIANGMGKGIYDYLKQYNEC